MNKDIKYKQNKILLKLEQNCAVLPPGAFWQKKHFFKTVLTFSAWIRAKSAAIYTKRHLQHDSVPFL